jgi:hypothetical protein
MVISLSPSLQPPVRDTLVGGSRKSRLTGDQANAAGKSRLAGGVDRCLDISQAVIRIATEGPR